MFYSQFILAKKGPLGTIWIAAHLERKLRKNQVADTDIGVSVDSIIFPEVPIALRLSSHLLLGVVRIYSRKVGYLFDDCSEALLKIKQAFRSAAVDLPPEESTAPYHSITLPETFDLDDFELPDNEIFHGNYVDHHVSAKEQITLQDTMEGVVYSTSQFGPDERFGDGDACQIGLDLTEEQDTLLGKAATPMNDGACDDDPQASLPPMTPFEADDNNECSISHASKSGLENDNGDQVEVLDEKPELSEYAEAPATPMLVEEANLSSIQEALVSDDHQESESHNLHCEMEIKQAETEGYSEVAEECKGHVQANGSLPSPSCPEAERPMLSESQSQNDPIDVLEGAEGTQNGIGSIEEASMCIDSQTETQNSGKLESRPAGGPMEEDGPLQRSSEDADCQLGLSHSPKVADGLDIHEELKDHETGSVLQKEEQSKFMKGLQPCNSNVINEGKSLFEGDQQCDVADITEVAVDGNQTPELALDGKVQAHAGDLLDQFYNEANLDLPAPEKLLSVSELNADKPNDLFVQSTPSKEGLDEGMRNISGRKRSLAESAMTMQSFGLSQSNQTVEAVPDDDDLLSSILVGRRSSVLKMKPTPAPLEIISSKRTRTAQRATASKRKVLMDETAVLLGDMIRQQLISTEDLRRVRKKAPCTLSEISMIQRQYLEDEIFSESTFPGLSNVLFYMHKETYDVSGTKICEPARDTAPAEATTKESSIQSNVNGEREKGVIRDDGEVHAVHILPQDENHEVEEFVADALINESDLLVDTKEEDEGRAERSDVQVAIDSFPEDTRKLPDRLATKANLMEKEGDEGASHLSSEHILHEQFMCKDSSEADMLAEGADAVLEIRADTLVAETGPYSGIGGSVDAENNCSIPGDDGDIFSGKTLEALAEHETLVLVENNEDAEGFGKSNVDAIEEADLQSISVLKDDFGPSIEHEGDTNYASLVDDKDACLYEDLEGKAAVSHADPEYMAIGIDTEFLNVDDDEVDEDNEHMSDAEDSRLLDNSGWSSRTRAVAKYLQTLFDKEAIRGKSVLPMDSLLAGKTRKEASRMFFESLVLKTRDYIQVEQGKPFDKINMKPRAKLMKLQF